MVDPSETATHESLASSHRSRDEGFAPGTVLADRYRIIALLGREDDPASRASSASRVAAAYPVATRCKRRSTPATLRRRSSSRHPVRKARCPLAEPGCVRAAAWPVW
ncbi:MAG: hypothetical protein AB1806_08015 [Acidobacteriota bacterium]